MPIQRPLTPAQRKEYVFIKQPAANAAVNRVTKQSRKQRAALARELLDLVLVIIGSNGGGLHVSDHEDSASTTKGSMSSEAEAANSSTSDSSVPSTRENGRERTATWVLADAMEKTVAQKADEEGDGLTQETLYEMQSWEEANAWFASATKEADGEISELTSDGYDPEDLPPVVNQPEEEPITVDMDEVEITPIAAPFDWQSLLTMPITGTTPAATNL